MKAISLRLTCIAILTIIFSCATSKDKNTDKLYSTGWELEYISGPRIAFDGLYPNKKPKISFNKERKEVQGNSSCNVYSAAYTMGDDSISFGKPGATTMMYCGEGEQVFLNIMQKINRYKIDTDGKLNLVIDEVSMMRFKRSEAM